MDADLNPGSDGGGGSALGQTAEDIDLMGAKSNELLFAQAVDPTPPNEEAVGLIFDINPLDPAVVAVVGAVVVCLVAATWWCRRKPSKTSRATTTLATGGSEIGTASAATGRAPSPVVQPRYNTRGPRVTSPGSGGSAHRASSPAPANRSSPPGKVMILTPQQLALCEVLYDVYNGVVPSRGIESKAVQECALSTADIRRQFKNIKRARELDRENASSSSDGNNNGSGAPPSSPTTPRRAAQSRLTRPSTRRASTAAAASAKQQPETGKKQSSSRGKQSSRLPVPSKRTAAAAAAAATTAPSTKKPPASPRSTPVKRGTATRSGSSSLKAGRGGGSPARAAKRAAPSSPPGRSAASVLPSSPPESPVRTRGRSNRTPSVRIGSPKSTPTKRAAATAAAAAAAASSPRSGGGGGTPAKRGRPSVLEIARREAQQQTVDVASARASSLRARRSSRSSTNTATAAGTRGGTKY